ncbi:MAG: hypothetical protein KF793_14285 [Nitrospira sp.]|nr:hypothetical protein [Nitrospira sp.]
MYEIIHDILAFIGGVIFSMTIILTPSIEHYMYPKLLGVLESHGKRTGSFSRGSIAALLWVAPLAIVFLLVIVIHKLSQIAFPSTDPHLFRRVMAWGMGLGLIGGLLIWRYMLMADDT